jgi:hypothetical protein
MNMPDFYPNNIMNKVRETAVLPLDGILAVPLLCGPVIPDDMTRYIFKIKADNATGGPIILWVFAGDAAVPARLPIGNITVQVGLNPASQANYPDPVDYSAWIFKVTPDTGFVPTQLNGIYFGDVGGGLIDNISYEYADVRGE